MKVIIQPLVIILTLGTMALAAEPATELPPQLPPQLAGLKELKGDEFFLKHVEALADIKAPAAQTYARRMADVLEKHKITLSDKLRNLLALPQPAQAKAETPLGKDDEMLVAAIVIDLLDINKAANVDNNNDEYLSLRVDLEETSALNAPALLARGYGAGMLAFGETEAFVTLSHDQATARLLVMPARMTQVWDSVISFALDPGNSLEKGRLPYGASSVLPQFFRPMDLDDEGTPWTCYGYTVAKPGPDVLTARIDRFVEQARKAMPLVTDENDQKALNQFIEAAQKAKPDLAGAAAEFANRPAAKQCVEDFIAAVNRGDRDAINKCVGPDLAKSLATTDDDATLLFVNHRDKDSHGVKDVHLLIAGRPELDTSTQPDKDYKFYVVLQGVDRKDGSLRYVGMNLHMSKDGDRWIITK